MKKIVADWIIKENIRLNDNYFLLKLIWQEETFPFDVSRILPGQFVQVLVEDSPQTFLRRPISIHYIEQEKKELWLLVQIVGAGTQKLSRLQSGNQLNIIFPLGNSFSLPEKDSGKKLLLVGGGVGIAPLLFLAQKLVESGNTPTFLLGARSKSDLLQLHEFEKWGNIFATTEDGSYGEKCLVTGHSVLASGDFDQIYTCGPKPMMVAIAKYAKQHNIPCEVSLENTMACGIGACLCCVEKTTSGNVCVCTEGPVFNINQLTWQI